MLNSYVVGLTLWLKSIELQLWWCFGTSVGNVEMLKEKLNSITEHMCNIHEFSDNEHFKHCGHHPLTVDEQRNKAWFDPDALVR